MTHEDFEKYLKELDGKGGATLAEKNARYSSSDDALHNFKMGAEIAGGTPAQACWGYMTKHLVALRDMVERDDFSNKDDFLEKCQDIINYIRFVWAIGNESNVACCKESEYANESCLTCKYYGSVEDEYPCYICRNAYPRNSTEFYEHEFKWKPKQEENNH